MLSATKNIQQFRVVVLICVYGWSIYNGCSFVGYAFTPMHEMCCLRYESHTHQKMELKVHVKNQYTMSV